LKQMDFVPLEQRCYAGGMNAATALDKQID
jgi:hypothetical protein